MTPRKTLPRNGYASLVGTTDVDEARNRWEAVNLPEPTVITQSNSIDLYWMLHEHVELKGDVARTHFRGILSGVAHKIGTVTKSHLAVPGVAVFDGNLEGTPCNVISHARERVYAFKFFAKPRFNESPLPNRVANDALAYHREGFW